MQSLEFSHTRLSLARSLCSYSKVQRLVTTLIQGRRAFMNLKTGGLILDVGCGPNVNSTKINLDYEWRPGIDICCDITAGLPLPDQYVAGVFSEHCLEHISFDAALFVLREFYRVLKAGAYVRIIVPDLEIYVERYELFRKTGECSMPYASGDVRADGIYSPALSMNRIFRSHGHQFTYDFAWQPCWKKQDSLS